ncbi:MAG: trypsin-like peptidase domain-containing protein [Gaiellaceae bacterium]|jgi:S1-C subfamily serine protease
MKSSKRQLASALGILVAGVLGASVALAVAAGLGDLGGATKTVITPTAESPIETALATNAGKPLSIPEIYSRTAPGVVQVTSTQIVSGAQLNPFFQLPSQKEEALGSGFVIDKRGDIVTNYHVIQGATKGSIRVLFSNNVTTKATIVGTDKSTDLAVLRVEVSPDALVPLSFGDSSALQVGDPVVAIGNPFALDRTATLGIVSAIYNLGNGTTSSPLRSQGTSSVPGGFPIAAIQTDAAINHGNSGGPLLNSLGQVVGVNSQIETGGTGQGNVGIGFAIQSNTVRQVVAQILKTGKATHAYLGVEIHGITPELASLYRLPVKQGLLVESVTPGSGAAKAGLKAGTHRVILAGQPYFIGGDIIVKADGTSIGSSSGKLEDIVVAHKPGGKLSLEIYRGSTKMTVLVTLGTRPF